MSTGDTSASDCDVAVIGGSVMGCFAAERMAREGLRVVVFEKDAVAGASTVCAGGMHADVASFVGIPDTVLERKLDQLVIRRGARERRWHWKRPVYLTVDRTRFDQFLSHRAAEAGADFHFSSRVVDADAGTGLVRVAGPTGAQAVRAHAILFADGPNSISRRIPAFSRNTGLRYAAVQVDLEGDTKGFEALEFILDPRNLPVGYAWVFPKRDRVSVGLGRALSLKGPPLWDLLERLIEGRPDLRGRAALRKRGAVIPATAARVLHHGRALLIGDAAGMVNPITGGGYVCGFSSAAVAAGTCIRAFRGGAFHPETLRDYPGRLRAAGPIRMIRAASGLIAALTALSKRTGIPLYPALLTHYCGMVHFLMRLGARSFGRLAPRV